MVGAVGSSSMAGILTITAAQLGFRGSGVTLYFDQQNVPSEGWFGDYSTNIIASYSCPFQPKKSDP
jgi:hypothetical protein